MIPRVRYAVYCRGPLYSSFFPYPPLYKTRQHLTLNADRCFRLRINY